MAKKRRSGSKVSLETFQIPWIDLGDLTTSQAAPAATARDYAAVVALTATGIVLWDVNYGYNVSEIRFSTTADADAHVVDVLVASGEDEFVRACTLTLTGGTQTAPAGARPTAGTFVDTMVLSNSAWPGDIEVIESGNNYISRLLIDLLGYDKIIFHATSLEGSSTLTIEGRGF